MLSVDVHSCVTPVCTSLTVLLCMFGSHGKKWVHSTVLVTRQQQSRPRPRPRHQPLRTRPRH